jgi:hypothetical protein
MAPGVLETMLKEKVIHKEQKQAAAAMLASLPETLALLKSAVEKIGEYARSEKRAGDLGGPADSKTAAAVGGNGPGTAGHYDSLTDPLVGRRTSLKKASDIALARGAQ